MDDVTEVATAPRRGSVLWTVVGAVIVIVATILYVLGVMYKPAYGSDRSANQAINCKTSGAQKACTVHLTIQPAVNTGVHATWLGYQVDTKDSRNKKIYPGTILSLPANATVRMAIRNFDSTTALRNPFFTLVQGTVGSIEFVNGKRTRVMNPDIASHTFTIPDFGVSVPMMGVPDNAKPTDFETMKFTFHTPNRKGVFRWQCIVPCGSGLYGNGGAMGELGYMQGLIALS